MNDVPEKVTVRRRVRPALRNVAIVAFLVLVPLAAHSLWDYIEVRRLVAEIERIKANGEPVTDIEAMGAMPQSGEGAASLYLAGAMLALEANPYAAMIPLREWMAEPVPDRAALPKISASLQQLVDSAPDALSLADKAARLPFTRFPGGTDFSYRTAGLGSLAQLVAARSLRVSLAGDGEAAVDSLISGLRIRRALRETRWWLPANNEIASVLSLARPSPDALRRLAEAFATEDVPDQARQRLLSDRAQFVEMMWRRFYGSEPASPQTFSLPVRSLPNIFMRPWVTHDLVDGLRLWAELADAAKTSWPEKARVSSEILARHQQQDRQQGRPAPSFMNGGVARMRALDAFSRAVDPSAMIVDRCSLVAVAVERFRHDRGELPGELSALVPAYLGELPVDPYSGQPLLFRTTPNAYTVYSIGPNQQDDAGDLTSEFQAGLAKGFGVRRIRGADIGVRVLTRM